MRASVVYLSAMLLYARHRCLHERSAPRRRARALRMLVLTGLLLMLVFVRASGLHLHGHAGSPAPATTATALPHLADFATNHDQHDGDVDLDLQGEGSLLKLPMPGLLPPPTLPVLVALLLATLLVQRRLPRTPEAAAGRPWRLHPAAPPPAIGPPTR